MWVPAYSYASCTEQVGVRAGPKALGCGEVLLEHAVAKHRPVEQSGENLRRPRRPEQGRLRFQGCEKCRDEATASSTQPGARSPW